jgi:hypothetical protein
LQGWKEYNVRERRICEAQGDGASKPPEVGISVRVLPEFARRFRVRIVTKKIKAPSRVPHILEQNSGKTRPGIFHRYAVNTVTGHHLKPRNTDFAGLTITGGYSPKTRMTLEPEGITLYKHSASTVLLGLAPDAVKTKWLKIGTRVLIRLHYKNRESGEVMYSNEYPVSWEE